MSQLGTVIERLYEVVVARKSSHPEASYIAKLYSKGRIKIAQKVGEEGLETALAGALNDKGGIISESADVLLHLSVLWADAGITPAEIAAELERREGVSGLAEKQSREEN